MQSQFSLAIVLVSRVSVVLAHVVLIPRYDQYLGNGATALMTLVSTLVAVLAAFDLGASVASSRAAAAVRINPANASEETKLVRAGMHLYLLVGVAAFVVMLLALTGLDKHWLVQAFGAHKADWRWWVALGSFCVLVPLTWHLNFYTTVLYAGSEYIQVSSVVLLGSVLRCALIWYGLTQGFGIAQVLLSHVLVSMLQLLYLRFSLARFLGAAKPQRISGHFGELIRSVDRPLAAYAVISALVLQSDKLILARFAPADEVAAYMVATTVSSVLFLAIHAVYATALPKMVEAGLGDAQPLLVYQYQTMCANMIRYVAPAAIFLVFLAPEVMLFWMGESKTSAAAADLLVWLTLGVAANAMVYPSYAVGIAKHRSDIALYVNLGVLLAYCPLLIYVTHQYGATAAALAWFFMHFGLLLIVPFQMHRALNLGSFVYWFWRGITLPCLLAWLVAWLLKALLSRQNIEIFWLLGLWALVWILTQYVISKISFAPEHPFKSPALPLK